VPYKSNIYVDFDIDIIYSAYVSTLRIA